MFKNVLVGVDGAPRGRDAISLASRLVDPAGKLTLAHVRGRELAGADSLLSGAPIGAREESEQILERERDEAHVEAELVRVEASSPGRGLHEEAERRNAELIVVGSSSRGALGRVMLGDDTRGALNGASCAVAIAAVGYAQHPEPIATVGVGYDGSPESKTALEAARQLAARTSATVQALEVASLPTYAYTGVMPMAVGVDLDVMLKAAAGRMDALPVDAHADYGVPGEELAAFGEKLDILIVGSRGYGPFGRLVHGSTSDYLQRHARCSLLVLPRASTAHIAGDGTAQTATSAGLPVSLGGAVCLR
jgi:nucleotide-binding universal stress UspA family protein